MRTFLALSLVLASLSTPLAAQQAPAVSWTELGGLAAPRPSPVSGYERCADLALPDSLELTTTPRTAAAVGYVPGATRTSVRMPPGESTLRVRVLEAWCTSGLPDPAPQILVERDGVHVVLLTEVPGAIAAAAGAASYLRVPLPGGGAAPATLALERTSKGAKRVLRGARGGE